MRDLFGLEPQAMVEWVLKMGLGTFCKTWLFSLTIRTLVVTLRAIVWKIKKLRLLRTVCALCRTIEMNTDYFSNNLKETGHNNKPQLWSLGG
jgi:hypothetical protein